MAIAEERAWQPLGEAAGRHLRWVRVRLVRTRYELWGGGDRFASLQWGKSLIGRTAAGEWALTPSGGFHGSVEVSSIGSSLAEAIYEPDGRRRGTIEFADGRKYRWIASRWRRKATWTTGDGRAVLHFRGRDVTIEAHDLRPSHLSVLILLAQYFNAMRSWGRGAEVAGIIGHLLSGFISM